MNRKSCSGVTLVEVLLGLPIVLAVIFGIVGFALYLNAQSTFYHAVPSSIRLAVTRGDSYLMGTELIKEIDCVRLYLLSEPLPAECDDLTLGWIELEDLLYYNNKQTPSGELVSDATMAENFYKLSSMAFCDDTEIWEAPASYMYALAYIYSNLRRAVGDSIRYPCSTAGPKSTGCISCTFRAPDPEMSVDCEGGDYQDAKNDIQDLPTDRISIECSYSPPNYVLSMLFRLLGSSETENNFAVLTTEASL